MIKTFIYACFEALLRSFGVLIIFSVLFWANYCAFVKHNWIFLLILMIGVVIGIIAMTYYIIFVKDKEFYKKLEDFEQNLDKTITELKQSKQN